MEISLFITNDILKYTERETIKNHINKLYLLIWFPYIIFNIQPVESQYIFTKEFDCCCYMKGYKMLYKRINYFLEVANCLSFSEAAKRKYITQQAMTSQIAALEKDLGVQLFVRSTRSVNLTEAGKMLRDDFTKINQEIQIATDKVRGLNTDNLATVSIGFYDGLSASLYIKPIIMKLQNDLPDTTFEIILADMITLRNRLMDGQIDLCITTATDWKEWPAVDISILKQFHFHVFLSHKHSLGKIKELDLNMLDDQTMYVLPSASLSRTAPYWQRRIPCKNIVTLPSLRDVLIYIEICRGFAVLPNIFDDTDTGKYKSFSLPFPDATADLILARRQRINTNALVNITMKKIGQFFQDINIPSSARNFPPDRNI